MLLLCCSATIQLVWGVLDRIQRDLNWRLKDHFQGEIAQMWRKVWSLGKVFYLFEILMSMTARVKIQSVNASLSCMDSQSTINSRDRLHFYANLNPCIDCSTLEWKEMLCLGRNTRHQTGFRAFFLLLVWSNVNLRQGFLLLGLVPTAKIFSLPLASKLRWALTRKLYMNKDLVENILKTISSWGCQTSNVLT